MIQELNETTTTTAVSSKSKSPLIEIVHEDSSSSPDTTTSTLVDTTLKSLVDHFNKPIHFQYQLEKYKLGIHDNNHIDDETSPRQAAALPVLPISVQKAKDRLASSFCSNDENSNNHQKIEEALILLLKNYITRIRPTLFQNKTQEYQQLHLIKYDGIPLLLHYESLLSELYSSWNTNANNKVREEQSYKEKYNTDDSSNMDHDTHVQDDETTITMALTIDALVHDITMITATKNDLEQDEGKTKQRIICNIVLPTMLRILVCAVNSYVTTTSIKASSPNNSKEKEAAIAIEKQHQTQQDAQKFYDVLATVAIAALTFRSLSSSSSTPSSQQDGTNDQIFKSSSSIDPRILDSTLSDELDGGNIMMNKYCVYPPQTTTTTTMAQQTDLYFKYGSVVNWKDLTLDGSMWNDSTTDSAMKVVSNLWNVLHTALVVQHQNNQDDSNPNSTHDDDNNDDKTCITARKVCIALGYQRMARIARAHFFARDTPFTKYMTQQENEKRKESTNNNALMMIQNTANTSNVRLFGKPSKKKEKEVLEKSFEVCPSRIYVVANLISLLDFNSIVQQLHASSSATTTSSNKTTTQPTPTMAHEFLSDMLPICFSLIDSTYPKHIAIGAAILCRLLREYKDDDTLSFVDFEDTIISVLELACRSCRKGGALALVCVARSRFFYNLLHYQQDDGREEAQPRQLRTKERRQATGQLLTILEKNSYREMDTEDGLILGLLVGGIIPLLHQHATIQDTISDNNNDDDNNAILVADSLEMGRIGLASLLPLLRWDYAWEGRRIQLVALVALINLLIGAYPMMTRHGGKIMCELLSCVGHADATCEKHCTIVEQSQYSGGEDDHLIENDVLNMALHTSAVALAVCGTRAASVLNQLQQEGNYEKYLLLHCQSIQERAALLLNRNSNEK